MTLAGKVKKTLPGGKGDVGRETNVSVANEERVTLLRTEK